MVNNSGFLTAHLGFRVKDSVFHEVQSHAQAEGISANEWCRKRVLQALRSPLPSPSDQALLAEIAATQDILVGLLCALGRDGRLPPQKAQEIVDAAHERKFRDVAALFKQAESRIRKGS